MKLTVVQDSEPDRWDDFVAAFPSSGPLHTAAWAECFRSERSMPIYLRLFSGRRPVGGIAGIVVEPKLPILRKIDRQSFFFCGPTLEEMSSPSIQAATLGLRRYITEQGFTSLVILGRDYPYSYDWGAEKVRLEITHEYIIDLSGPLSHVRARMRRSISEQARKAERSGLTYHEHRDASMLPSLLRLLGDTRSRRRRISGIQFNPYYIPHLAERTLRNLAESGIARFFVARRADDVLCVLLAFTFSHRAYALLIGCSDEGYRQRAPAFLWRHAIDSLHAAGIESLNLAGAGPQSTLAFAKLSLGAERRMCTGAVSPYLQGPVSNLLFQLYRWRENLPALATLVRDRVARIREPA